MSDRCSSVAHGRMASADAAGCPGSGMTVGSRGVRVASIMTAYEGAVR